MTAPKLYAKMEPQGRWDQPCDVYCACGWLEVAETCDHAQRLCQQHDEQHWAGAIPEPAAKAKKRRAQTPAS